MSLQRRTAVGVLWNFAEQMARRGTTVVVTLLLAYFLEPDDYGLVAMTAVFVAIAAQMMDGGLREAVIRKQEVDDDYLHTAFVSNLVLSFAAYTTLFVVAPLVAGFYDEPRITAILRIVGLLIPVQALQVVHQAYLSRQLAFRTIMAATVPATVLSGGLAVLLAWLGVGVWALVAQRLVATVLTTGLLWAGSTYRPRARFHLGSFRHMASFGYKLFLAGIINTAFENMYVVAVAKLFSSAAAGQYFFANRIKTLALNQLVNGVQRATFPALAQVQDDPARLKKGYRGVLTVTTFVVAPTMTTLIAIAEPAFKVALSPHWGPAVPLLQLLCIEGLIYPLNVVNVNLLRVTGRSDIILGLQVGKRFLAVVVLMFASQYGVEVVVLGQVCVAWISYLPNSYYSAKLIGYSTAEQVRDVVPYLGLALISGGLATAAGHMPTSAWAQVCASALMAGGGYVVAAWMLKLSAVSTLRRLVAA